MNHLFKPANRRPTIGVLASWQVYAGMLNTLLSPILQGLGDAAQARECNMLMACGVVSGFSPNIRAAWPLLSPEMDFLPVGHWNTDGLIVIAPRESDPAQSQYIRELREMGHPLVFVETSEMSPAVCLDNAGGIRQALAHLQAHGHRRVAFVGGETGGGGDSFERLQAYQDGCRELGLESDPQLIRYGHFTTPGGYSVTRQIIESDVPFTALLACNDESAVGAIQALKEAGRHIPQDVAVIGFDNRFESRSQNPPLTTVNLPAYEIGWQSLELMLQRLSADTIPAITRVATQLVIRESCGCKPGSVSISSASATGTPQTDWAEAISNAVFAQAGHLQLRSIRSLATRLVDGFTRSVDESDAAPFQTALQEIIEQVKTLDEDAHAWQSAIQYLRQRWREGERSRPPVLEWLDEARMALSECAQFQLLRYFSGQNGFTQQLSLMSAELSETVELGPIQGILDRYAPNLGIRHVRLVLFEPGEADPVAWSVAQAMHGNADASQRFLTRSFPPADLYPDAPPYQLALLPLLIQKQPAGFLAFDASNLDPCLAVARQVTSALENIRLYSEAERGRQLAEEANRLKSRFLSTVSHELRTPLNLIVGWSEMQLKEPGADAKFAGRIHTSAQHLGRLIRDVLDLASSDAGQLRLICEPLNLGEALQMVSETGHQMAAEKGLEWKTEIPTHLPLVWGDRTRLQQITLNLISNAVKFTAQGSVTLQISTENGQVQVAVRDTGLGIVPSEQAWIFDEFRQSERTTVRGYGGLGLGLAICKRLVELHNGEIGIESTGEEGAGSTFYFRLPVFKDEQQESAPLAQQQEVLILSRQLEASEPIKARLQRAGFAVQQQAVADGEIPDWLSRLLVSPPGALVLDEPLAAKYGWELLKVLKGNPHTAGIPVLFYSLNGEHGNGSVLALDYLMKPVASGELLEALARQGWVSGEGEGKTILIADDDPGMLEMNSRMIQENFPGHRVLKASDGRAALEILSKVPVQLVLLDLMMPEVDGFGVLSQMREWEATRETAVIVLTSKTLTEADMARLSQGVAMVMGKGLYGAQEMLAHIEAALSRSHRLGSESQRLVRKAMAYIHQHYASTITREELARHVNASDGHLARCFRQETGLTPMNYLNRYRINQSQTLLATTRQSVTAIALACGFADVNYFSRVFRQETDMSPLAYRRKHQP